MEEAWEAERKGDNLADIILRDACFSNYLSLPDFIDIKRGISFFFVFKKQIMSQ